MRFRKSKIVLMLVAFAMFGERQGASAALRFLKSEPNHFDFADQRALPPSFGVGEFTFELWIKPDASFPVGFTDRGTLKEDIHNTTKVNSVILNGRLLDRRALDRLLEEVEATVK